MNLRIAVDPDCVSAKGAQLRWLKSAPRRVTVAQDRDRIGVRNKCSATRWNSRVGDCPLARGPEFCAHEPLLASKLWLQIESAGCGRTKVDLLVSGRKGRQQITAGRAHRQLPRVAQTTRVLASRNLARACAMPLSHGLSRPEVDLKAFGGETVDDKCRNCPSTVGDGRNRGGRN